MLDAVPITAPAIDAHERSALEISTKQVRRFLGIKETELIELTAFVNGRAWINQVTNEVGHIDALRRADGIRGFCGAYMLVNGPLEPTIGYRYTHDTWQPANNKRASDRDIGQRRALFVDIDPVRVSGISATDDERHAALDVATNVREWLSAELGKTAIGHGCSGNGYYILIAIEPVTNPNASTSDVSRFLKAIDRKFGTERVKIDSTVSTPARLMAAPGTWKRKGSNTKERPHRLTTFSCCGTVDRVEMATLL